MERHVNTFCASASQAARAARQVIYLDRGLAIAHFVLGSILQHMGDQSRARRAYRNARELCAVGPGDQVVPFSDGEKTGRLAEAVAAQLAMLDSTLEDTP